MPPLLVIEFTVAPLSISSAVAVAEDAPPACALTDPPTVIAGTLAPAPIRTPVALAPVASAVTVPFTVIPPATWTAWPVPADRDAGA